MAPANRVLIDSDHAAAGIWLIEADETHLAQLVGAGTVASPEFEMGVTCAWGGLIPIDLLVALKRWNDECSHVGLRSITDGVAVSADVKTALDFRGHELAGQVQAELGDEWEVLYSTGAAWHWVRRPLAWPMDDRQH
jgi:hypothetical protein